MLSLEEIALQLVQIEKEKPSLNQTKDAITLYQEYLKKVEECRK